MTGSGLCARWRTAPFCASLTILPCPAEKENHEITGSLSFLAGSAAGGYGTGSDMSTGFTLERSIFSDGHLAVSGNVGLRQQPSRGRRPHQLFASPDEWL